MGDLFDKLQQNATKAAEENKELEVEREKLISKNKDLEAQFQELVKSETKH